MHSVDIGNASSWYDGPAITVPDKPGLGIVIDEALVDQVRTGQFNIE